MYLSVAMTLRQRQRLSVFSEIGLAGAKSLISAILPPHAVLKCMFYSGIICEMPFLPSGSTSKWSLRKALRVYRNKHGSFLKEASVFVFSIGADLLLLMIFKAALTRLNHIPTGCSQI